VLSDPVIDPSTRLRGTLVVDADVRKRLGHCVRFDLDCAGARRHRILEERKEKKP
jgi:hypothetical protein